MRPCAGTASHRACGQIALYGGICARPSQVAEVLERLGIALADHWLPPEHIDQLPRITVGMVLIVCRSSVIFHRLADVVFIRNELLIVGFVRIIIYHTLRRFHSIRGGGCFCSIGLGRIVTAAISHRIVLGDHESHIIPCHGQRVSAGGGSNPGADTLCFIHPIHFVGMVRKQQLEDHLGIKALIFQSFRYLLCQNIYSFPILYFFLKEGVVGSKAKLCFCKAHLYTGRTQPETCERDCAVAKRSVGDFRNFSRQKLHDGIRGRIYRLGAPHSGRCGLRLTGGQLIEIALQELVCIRELIRGNSKVRAGLLCRLLLRGKDGRLLGKALAGHNGQQHEQGQ